MRLRPLDSGTSALIATTRGHASVDESGAEDASLPRPVPWILLENDLNSYRADLALRASAVDAGVDQLRLRNPALASAWLPSRAVVQVFLGRKAFPTPLAAANRLLWKDGQRAESLIATWEKLLAAQATTAPRAPSASTFFAPPPQTDQTPSTPEWVHLPSPFSVVNGGRYLARLRLSGLEALAATAGLITAKLKDAGFADVTVSMTTPPPGAPASAMGPGPWAVGTWSLQSMLADSNVIPRQVTDVWVLSARRAADLSTPSTPGPRATPGTPPRTPGPGPYTPPLEASSTIELVLSAALGILLAAAAVFFAKKAVLPQPPKAPVKEATT